MLHYHWAMKEKEVIRHSHKGGQKRHGHSLYRWVGYSRSARTLRKKYK